MLARHLGEELLGIPHAELHTISVGLSVMFDPAMHGTLAEPALEGVRQKHRAVLALEQGRWALAFDPKKSPAKLLEEVAEAFGFGCNPCADRGCG